MPNGYGTLQVYFPTGESDLLHFVRDLPRGEQSRYVREAIRLKRAMDGEETLVSITVRRVIQEELERFLSQMPKNSLPNFGENFETFSEDEGDESDLADFVGRNRF